MRRFLSSALAPWSGLFLGAFAWALDHQIGSGLVFADCRLGGPWLTAGLGAICGLLTTAGGALSWASRGAGDEASATRRFGSMLGLAGAGLFLLAIVLQSLPGLIIPACHR